MSEDILKKHNKAKSADAFKMFEKATGGMVWFGVVRANALRAIEAGGAHKDAIQAAYEKFDEKAHLFEKAKGENMSPNDVFQLMLSAFFIGSLLEPSPEAIQAINDVLGVSKAKEMRKALAEKKTPAIEKRKDLLRKKPDGYLELIVRTRKEAEAAAIDFARECDDAGISHVSGKQLQRYARDILEERRERLGHSLRAPR
jgi:hypothetical protein